MSRLRKLLTLPYSRVRSLIRAIVLLAMARRKHTHQPMALLIEQIKVPLNAHCPGNPKIAAEIAWALRVAAAQVPWRADCLIRAIAARQWAELSELPYEFHLGVSFSQGGALKAHAWSVSGSTVISGDIPELGRFTEFNLEELPVVPMQFTA
jgi:hypothetical protein